MMRKLCDFVSKWMGILVLLTATLAFLYPQSTAYASTKYITPLLGLVMFGMGLTLKASDFRILINHPKEVLAGCMAQYTVMPCIALLLSAIFRLQPDLSIGIILVGCCPGGTASNVITYMAKGDLALSVGMTACSTLLAPVLTPLIVWQMAGKSIEVDTLGMLIDIVQVVIAPILAGFAVKHHLPRITERIVSYLPALSSIVVAMIVFIIIGKNSDKLHHSGLLIIAVVVLHNLLGLLLGYGIGRVLKLSHSKCTAISIEVGMQNSGLASKLALTHFAAYPMATIPGALFSVWHNLSGTLAAKIYSGR